MPATDRETRNQTQRNYTYRNREVVNARRRKEPPAKLCNHCNAPFKAVPYNRRYCITCLPPNDNYAKDILRRFGLSRPEYDAMYETQNGFCAMPGCSNKALAVDHNHTTGKVRALLCIPCNVFVGWYENTNRVLAVINYLETNT